MGKLLLTAMLTLAVMTLGLFEVKYGNFVYKCHNMYVSAPLRMVVALLMLADSWLADPHNLIYLGCILVFLIIEQLVHVGLVFKCNRALHTMNYVAFLYGIQPSCRWHCNHRK